MPDSAIVEQQDLRPDLEPAARNVVRTCLAVRPGEVAVLVTDLPTAELAAPVLAELRAAGASTRTFVLDSYGRRPLHTCPPPLEAALGAATVSLLMVRPEPGELEIRGRVVELAQSRGLRHAHMPGIDAEAMTTAMLADYGAVSRLQARLVERLAGGGTIHLASDAGTAIDVVLDPGLRWVRNDGIIRSGRPQNLPTGLLETTPATAEGVYVADAAIGDWFGARYGGLSEHPLRLTVSGGRLREASCDNEALARQVMLYVRSSLNGDRVGEIGLGTNLALDRWVGKVLLDQNVPGAVLTFGGAATLKLTGASWSSRTHVPVVGRRCDVSLDGEALVRAGRYVDALLD